MGTVVADDALPQDRALELLAPGVRQWVLDQGWQGLRPVQVAALRPVLEARSDVLVFAATASGKTEAAFLPALSRASTRPHGGTAILYLSPLKALINDQVRRLGDLAARLGLPLIAWHGDQSREAKSAYRAHPAGILLTTPESLEGFLRNRDWCCQAFGGLDCVIIDEFHSFAGSERGMQLLALLHRIEGMAHRPIPRIALSATFGSVTDMVRLLRPHRDPDTWPCAIVSDDEARKPVLQVRTYTDVPPYIRLHGRSSGLDRLVDDLYGLLAGGHHLVFTNSRRRTEQVAAKLVERCSLDGRPNEFFPHHGSLSRELRRSLEQRLQDPGRPTTAVCTMTLELGIDIGNMDSVAQLDPPASVASLRQRLGRAGRRGEPQTLRLFLLETSTRFARTLSDNLRLGLFQSLAVLRLLEQHWYEPVEDTRPHYSTLVQQLLSMLVQYGSLRPSVLWDFLCRRGPFPVGSDNFLQLLAGLARRGLVRRRDREVELTRAGLELVGGVDFGTAFRTPAEYELVHAGSRLGRMPLAEPLKEGQRILFAGRAWRVATLDLARQAIFLEPDAEGEPPRFGGASRAVHSRVRQAMYELYAGGREPTFLNHTGRKMFQEGQKNFADFRLAKNRVLVHGGRIYLFPWQGDRFCRTVTALLRLADLDANDAGGIIDVNDTSLTKFLRTLQSLLAGGRPDARTLTAGLAETLEEKYDSLVDERLRAEDMVQRFYELDAAWAWLEEVMLPANRGRISFG